MLSLLSSISFITWHLVIKIAIYKRKIQYVLVPALAFLIGVGAFNLAVLKFNKSVNTSPKEIEARIYNVSKEKDGMIMAYADNIKFDEKDENTNIIIYVYDNTGLFENIKVGNVIQFKPYRFYKTELFYNAIPNSNLYNSNLKYTTSVLAENIIYESTNKTLAEQFKESTKENLTLGLTNENVEIAYSALFGDKDLLSDKQYNSYKLSGVAHLLAVSGLHVGIIVGILSVFLKCIKVKRWWKFLVISIFLCFYMYLCSFAVSIIRASIMSLILMIANILGKEYDPFNSISVAGILIFLINPMCVFDVAFLLSFSCVIGIVMLYMPIENFLKKTKISEKLIKIVATSISTTTAIVFVMAFYFRTLNIISILANVILIPIFTFAFTIIFIVSILSFILPQLCYLLCPLNYVLDLINLLATLLGNLSISNFNTTRFNYIAIILYFILLLFMGRFCTSKHKYKMITTLPMVALLVYCLL